MDWEGVLTLRKRCEILLDEGLEELEQGSLTLNELEKRKQSNLELNYMIENTYSPYTKTLSFGDFSKLYG